MADNQGPDIDIVLKTTAETQGAEDTKTALEEVDAAAQKAARHQDVITAQQRVATREAKANAEALREIADGQQRLVAAGLAEALGKIGGQFRGLSPEIDMATQATDAFLRTLASTGNPLAALIALSISAIASVVNAQREADKAMESANKNLEESFAALQRSRASLEAHISTQKLQQFFRLELNELEDQEAALGRIIALRAKERELATAQERAANAAATRAGGDPYAESAKNLFDEQNAAIQSVQDALVESREKVQSAEDQATSLKFEAAQLAAANDAGSDVAKAAAEKADAAQRNYQKLADALPTLEQIAAIDVEKIQTDFETKSAELGTQAGAALAKAATEQIAKIEESAAASGQEISLGMQGVIAHISKLVADGMVDSDELPELVSQLNRVRSTSESNDKQIFDGVTKLIGKTETLNSLIPGLTSRIRALEEDQATSLKFEAAQLAAANDAFEAAQLAAANDAGSDVAKAAAEKADAAQRNYQKLADALPTLEQIAAIDVEKIQTDFETKSAELGTQAGAALAKAATEQIAKIEESAAASGQEISLGMQGVIAHISKLVADGMVDSDELPELVSQLNRVRSTRESNDKQIFDGVTKLIGKTETLTSLIPGLTSRIRALEEDQATSLKFEAAQLAAANDAFEAAQLAAANDAGSDVAKADAEKADAAQRNYQKLADALPTLEQIAAIDVEKIQTDFETKSAELGTQAGAALAKAATEQIAKIEESAAASGQEISLGMQGVIAHISKLVADGMVDSDELPELVSQLNRVRSTRESNDKQIFDGVTKLIGQTETLTSLIPGLTSRIRALEADIQTLKNAPQ